MKTLILQQVFDAAKAHGEQTEPDHEVGDLQDVLWACFSEMPDDMGAKVLNNFADFVEEWSK